MEHQGFVHAVIAGRNRYILRLAVIAALGGFLFGYDTGVISGALLFLHRDLHADALAQESIVGALLVGAVIGAAASGVLADRWSRKWTLAVAGAIYVVGALGSAAAGGVSELVAARFVLGLAVGAASFVAPMYLSEMAPPAIRGGIVTFNQTMLTTGILIAYIADFALKGVAGNWRWMLGLGALPGLALLLGMLLLPHTPHWLARKGRDEEARGVLLRVREESEVDRELAEIHDLAVEQASVKLRDVFAPSVRPALIIGVGLAIFQQIVGINTVIYYAPTILASTGLHAGQAITETVFIGLTNVVFTVVAVVLMDRVGRRALLLTGTVGLTIALAVLAIFFEVAAVRHAAPALALVALLVYIASFAIGLGPVFWLMIAEVSPLRVRGPAMSLATMANWGFNFLVSFTFLTLIAAIGTSGAFWLYAAMGVAAIAFFSLRVPETKGRTLEEIEHDLNGRRPSDRRLSSASGAHVRVRHP